MNNSSESKIKKSRCTIKELEKKHCRQRRYREVIDLERGENNLQELLAEAERRRCRADTSSYRVISTTGCFHCKQP